MIKREWGYPTLLIILVYFYYLIFLIPFTSNDANISRAQEKWQIKKARLSFFPQRPPRYFLSKDKINFIREEEYNTLLLL